MISWDAVFFSLLGTVILAAVMLCGPDETVAYVQDVRGAERGGGTRRERRTIGEIDATLLCVLCAAHACHVCPVGTHIDMFLFPSFLLSCSPVPVRLPLLLSLFDVRYWQKVRCASIRLCIGFVLSFEGTIPAPIRMLCRLCIEGEEEEERSRASTLSL